MDEKIIKKNAVPVIAAMITALAFSFTGLPMDGNTSVEKMSNVYNGLGCTSLLAWILLLILYVKGWEGYRKYRNWQAHVLAVIFSAGMLLGTSYFTNGNWDFLFGAKKQILISAGCFIGFYIICDMGITYFWRIPEMEFFRKACGRIPAREEKIVSRKKELTEEEKKLFTYFVTVPGMKEQLLDVLCDVQMGAADKTSQTGNVIVMGGRETGKTRLISSLIPAICKELNIEASKVAYIFADDLNGKDIPEIVSKLAGGFLVIEDANQLSQETADELEEAMTGNTKGMIVILEDEKIGMRKLIARYPKLAKKFTSMINIPVFTNDELVNFAKVYTMENGFRIDQMGMLALYNLIGINQKEDQPMCIGTVKTMLDKAMERAQSGLFKRSKKRVDRDGYTVLFEKDFS